MKMGHEEWNWDGIEMGHQSGWNWGGNDEIHLNCLCFTCTHDMHMTTQNLKIAQFWQVLPRLTG